MIRLADTNVVFALLVEGHEHHARAWRWWQRRPDASVAWFLPVRLGALRLLTNAVVMEGEPLACAAALDAWDKFNHDPRTMELGATGAAQERAFRQFVRDRRPTPNLWTDAWLAALAESEGIGLSSFDAGFREFKLRDFELLKT
ncbi:MAG: TA system VapC family ribonuclease toxin [Chthoniobacterales bacterium]